MLLERHVALKVSHSANDVFVAAMLREARHLARVDHPNIVTVFDAGAMNDGRRYIACEFVDGPSLADYHMSVRKNEGRDLTLYEVAEVGLAMARALEATHMAGTLHRDIKGANILVPLERGLPILTHAKLVDFGVAASLKWRSDSGERQTSTRIRSGTSLYAAPEQLTGRRQSVATDVYILGAMLFELLVGFPPMCPNKTVAQFELPVVEGLAPVRIALIPSRLEEEVVFPDRVELSSDIRQLLGQMLRMDAAERPQMANAACALELIRDQTGVNVGAALPSLPSTIAPTVD
jgi:serine/threonine-protein kinase